MGEAEKLVGLGRSVTVVGDVVYYLFAFGIWQKGFNTTVGGLSSEFLNDYP